MPNRQPSPERTDAFVQWLAAELEAAASAIAHRWLEVLCDRLPEHPARIFPKQALLNHIPDVLTCLARAFAQGTDPCDDLLVVRDLADLAQLRRTQGYDLEEVLQELELLNDILFERSAGLTAAYEGPLEPADAILALERLRHAVHPMKLLTTRAFLAGSSKDRGDRSAMLSAFGRAVSHELRNRLSSAALRVELARTGNPEALEALEHALERVASVVDDVFAIAVSSGSKRVGAHDRMAFDELAAAIVEELEPLAEAAGIELRLDPALPTFQIDATRVPIVLVNLVSNAIKYRDPEKAAYVEIRAAPLSGPSSVKQWRVEVCDNGPGIPQSLAESIFQPRVRGPHEQEGEGLGLAIAYEAVSQMGGRIWVESEPGVGSTFAFTVTEPSDELG